jgi:hypothetical protein
MLRVIALLILGLWLGAIAFFSFGVASHPFAVLGALPNGRLLAGQIVFRSLTSLHLFGIICGLLYILLSTLAYRSIHLKRNVIVFVMVLITFFAQYWIAPRIERQRAEVTVSSIQELPERDPRRVRFARLHAASMAAALTCMFLGIITFSGTLLFERRETM